MSNHFDSTRHPIEPQLKDGLFIEANVIWKKCESEIAVALVSNKFRPLIVEKTIRKHRRTSISKQWCMYFEKNETRFTIRHQSIR